MQSTGKGGDTNQMTMGHELTSTSEIITVRMMWECHGIKKPSVVKRADEETSPLKQT